jgi:hypothetical protein
MEEPAGTDTKASAPRPRRADARRNVDALLEAARGVFEVSGVDAPAKQITDLAGVGVDVDVDVGVGVDVDVGVGVGVGVPLPPLPTALRSVVAVLHREIDACADAAGELGAAHDPTSALARWLDRYTAFLATKQGLAAALHSDDPAFEALRGYFSQRLEPALQPLLDVAAATGRIRDDVSANDLLRAVALLSLPISDEGPEYGRRMVAVFIDGLRLEAQEHRRDLRSSVHW